MKKLRLLAAILGSFLLFSFGSRATKDFRIANAEEVSVAIEGISLNYDELIIPSNVGKIKLTPIFEPENASNKNLNITCSDDLVASYMYSPGSQITIWIDTSQYKNVDSSFTINVETIDGGFSASCEVNRSSTRGTEINPFSVSEFVTYSNCLYESSKTVYVSGKVSQVEEETSRRQKFYLTDCQNHYIYVYTASQSSVVHLNVGEDVIVSGKLYISQYNGFFELNGAYISSRQNDEIVDVFLENYPDQTTYDEGQNFNPLGMSIRIECNSGKSFVAFYDLCPDEFLFDSLFIDNVVDHFVVGYYSFDVNVPIIVNSKPHVSSISVPSGYEMDVFDTIRFNVTVIASEGCEYTLVANPEDITCFSVEVCGDEITIESYSVAGVFDLRISVSDQPIQTTFTFTIIDSISLSTTIDLTSFGGDGGPITTEIDSNSVYHMNYTNRFFDISFVGNYELFEKQTPSFLSLSSMSGVFTINGSLGIDILRIVFYENGNWTRYDDVLTNAYQANVQGNRVIVPIDRPQHLSINCVSQLTQISVFFRFEEWSNYAFATQESIRLNVGETKQIGFDSNISCVNSVTTTSTFVSVLYDGDISITGIEPGFGYCDLVFYYDNSENSFSSRIYVEVFGQASCVPTTSTNSIDDNDVFYLVGRNYEGYLNANGSLNASAEYCPESCSKYGNLLEENLLSNNVSKISFFKAEVEGSYYIYDSTYNSFYKTDQYSKKILLSDLEGASLWKVSFNENGDVLIQLADATDDKCILFNVSYCRIYNYSNPGMAKVRLFKSTIYSISESELEEFCSSYLHMEDYNENLGYCNDTEHHYYSDAKEQFNTLSEAMRYLFRTKEEYSSARARFETWAAKNNDPDPYDGSEFVMQTLEKASISSLVESDVAYWPIVVSISTTVVLIAFTIIIKTKKRID